MASQCCAAPNCSTYEPFIACVGVVLLGSGFWASAMRNMVIGLWLLVRTPFEYRMHGRVEELFEWLPAAHETRTGVVITPTELSALRSEARRWQVERAVPASLPRA
ncbi:MAG: hypothetical protein ABW252_14535 [Polyangiales bacterium]